MGKRSPAANLGRVARRAVAKRAKPAAAAPAPEVVVQQPVDLAPEQVVGILQQQLGVVLNAFTRLAQARAADRVRFNELTWDQGTEYINNEINGLQQQLAVAVSSAQQPG